MDGSNQSANASQLNAINITYTERQQLATLYQPNQSLWRVPITHFSDWDFNWPFRPDCDPAVQSCAPNQPPPDEPIVDDPDCQGGSIIGCQDQVLGEAVEIAGTPFRFHYQSDRVPGRKEANTLKIPLSGASVPESLKGINLEVFVAGRSYSYSFPAAQNQTQTFIWDGKDAYGRIL